MKQEKTAIEQEWRGRLETEKSEAQRSIDEYKAKAALAESEAKEAERQKLQSESEFDKEAALKDQKIAH